MYFPYEQKNTLFHLHNEKEIPNFHLTLTIVLKGGKIPFIKRLEDNS